MNKTDDLKVMMERKDCEAEDNLKSLLSDSILLGMARIKEYLSLDMKTITKQPKHVTDTHYKMAKLTHDLIRERNIQKRTEEGMKIRIYHLSAEDKPKFQEMVTEGLPAYSP